MAFTFEDLGREIAACSIGEIVVLQQRKNVNIIYEQELLIMVEQEPVH